MHHVESWGVEEGFIGFRPALSPGRWVSPYDYHFTKDPRESIKVGDMLWGPCDADCSPYPPVLFRLFWTLEYLLQHRCRKSKQTQESVARIPDLFINCADTFELIDFLLFCYFNTREFVSFKGAVLLMPACFIHVCVVGGGEWVPESQRVGQVCSLDLVTKLFILYILRLPACSSPSLNFLLFSLLPPISFKKPLLCTITNRIGLLFFVVINSTFRVRLAGSE